MAIFVMLGNMFPSPRGQNLIVTFTSIAYMESFMSKSRKNRREEQMKLKQELTAKSGVLWYLR